MGIDAAAVTVEVNIAGGGLGMYLVGLPDSAVKESEQRIRAAFENSGERMSGRKVVVSLAPADLRKEGASFDLPIAVGILAAMGRVDAGALGGTMFAGELSLDGTLKPVRGVLPMAVRARGEGLRRLVLPADNAREAAVVEGIDVLGAGSLKEVMALLNGEADGNDTFLEINAGAGGTESADWASMLARMYVRWAEKKGYKVELQAISEGEEAGIKSVSYKISGPNAYGWLKSESGVHRLVRISPYDSAARRHTSFSSVWVYPVVDDNIDIVVNPNDIRIDTYRSTGAGGQHVNTTDSAVRITHVPTNTVVSCQNERSQHANKDTAMKMLRAKLYELEMMKRNAASQALEDSKSDIGWGHQIRSYVLDDSRIKDLRTGVERSDCQKVLDGDLDQYLEASLKQGL